VGPGQPACTVGIGTFKGVANDELPESEMHRRAKSTEMSGNRPHEIVNKMTSCAQASWAIFWKSFLFNPVFENKRDRKIFGSARMEENVPSHAWSPPNFPHSEEEAKAPVAAKADANFGASPKSESILCC
jgi:hypothetical protein